MLIPASFAVGMLQEHPECSFCAGLGHCAMQRIWEEPCLRPHLHPSVFKSDLTFSGVPAAMVARRASSAFSLARFNFVQDSLHCDCDPPSATHLARNQSSALPADLRHHSTNRAGAASSRAELLGPAPLSSPCSWLLLKAQCQGSSPSHICSGSWDVGLHRWGLVENFASRAAVDRMSCSPLVGCLWILHSALGVLLGLPGWCMPVTPLPQEHRRDSEASSLH